MVNKNKDDFYDKYHYLKPNCEKDWLEKAWDGCKSALKSAGEWCKEHWKEILITIVIVIGAVLAIAAVICTGGMALAPLLAAGLTALGVSAGTAMTIATVTSLVVATIAVTSTLASSTLNIMDTWGDYSDNPTFQAWKTAMNWTSMISNGFYSIGSIYNSFKGISNSSLREYSKNWLTNSNFRNAIAGADKFNLMVKPNSSTFWAGLGRDGENVAKSYASSTGRTTLESTMESQSIMRPTSDLGWQQASSSYALRYSGNVQALLTDAVGNVREGGKIIGNTWLNTERILLNVNPYVTNINNISRTFQFSSYFSGLFSISESVVNVLQGGD